MIKEKFFKILSVIVLAAVIISAADFYGFCEGGEAELQPGLQYIDNKICYVDSDLNMASSIGVDSSFYNGKVDFKELKKLGIDFVILRVGGRGWGNGALYEDGWFQNAVKSAHSAGLSVGVYFYSMAVNRGEAAREAEYCIEKLCGETLELPVYIDMEFSGDYPSGRTDSLPTAERVDFAHSFCKVIKDAGYLPGVYANESFFHDELNLEALSDYSIWLASYTENNIPPKMEGYDIWQFTDRARIPGISGYCDLNVIFEREEYSAE